MEPSDASDRFDPRDGTSPPAVVEDEAGHLGEELAETKSECRSTVLENPGLHHVAHYSSGVYDFAMDVLDDPARGPGVQLPSGREGLRGLGRQLCFVAGGLDRTLQEVRTGALIRTILHTEEGAVCCNSVVPREYVVGVAFDRSAATHPDEPLTAAVGIRTADQAISDLATRLRRRISQGSQNPGGWLTQDPAEQTVLPEDASAPPLDSPPRTDGDGLGQVADACVRAVHPADLHFVAHCGPGEVAFVADHFGHSLLRRFFTQITVEARLKFYASFSDEFRVLASRLNRMITTAFSGVLVRIVLDVEQGAIYYYPIGAGDYLVGVTLDQQRVSQADDRMARLALDCREIMTTSATLR